MLYKALSTPDNEKTKKEKFPSMMELGERGAGGFVIYTTIDRVWKLVLAGGIIFL